MRDIKSILYKIVFLLYEIHKILFVILKINLLINIKGYSINRIYKIIGVNKI